MREMEMTKRHSSARTVVLFACISVLIIGLFACDDRKDSSSAHSGKLRLSLTADTTSLKKGVNSNLTKAVSDEFEKFLTVEDYQIRIVTDKDTVKSYDRFDKMPSEIELPEGAYTIVASKGNDLPAAFENPYFEGSTAFTIKEGMSTPLDMTCTLGNARITAEYTDDFKEAYSDYTALLSSTFATTEFEIAKGETRPAYMQVAKEGTDVAIGIRLKKINAEEEKTYYVPTALKLERRQNVRLVFKTDGEALEGIGLTIMLDDSLEEKNFTTEIPDFMWKPFDKPTLVPDGFEDGEDMTIKTSVFDDDLQVGFVMPGGVNSLIVKHWKGDAEDDAEIIDLVSEPEKAKEKYLSWIVGENEYAPLKGTKAGYLILKNAIKSLKAQEDEPMEYHYSFYGKDNTGKEYPTNEVNLSVIVEPADAPFIEDFELPSEIVEGDELETNIKTILAADAVINEEKTTLTIEGDNIEPEIYHLMRMEDRISLYEKHGIGIEFDVSTKLQMVFLKPFTALLSAPKEGGSRSYAYKLHLEDSNGKVIEETKTILVKAPVLNLVTTEGDAFAERIILRVNLSEDATCKHLRFQYKPSGASVWSDVESAGLKAVGEAKNGFIQYVDTLKGLIPLSSYLVRAVYNQDRSSESASLITEEALPIEGGDMDIWTRTYVDEGYSGLVALKKDVTIYDYENDSPYWHTNNASTVGSTTFSSYIAYQTFPLVSYIINGKGKAAVIRSMGLKSGNTAEICYDDSRHRGKLYFGSANEEGLAFASRPFGLKFDYKYDAYDSESFEVYAVVKNGNTILGEAHYTNNVALSDFKEIVIPFDYTNYTQKAEKIYIYFYSSTKDQPSVAKKVSIQMENGAYTVHAGSCLYIDNVELTY